MNDNFFKFFTVITGVLAIGVALRQTLNESIAGTYPFLYHRPADRRSIIAMKLLVGMSGCVLCSAAAILAYGVWAATPGTHASPFLWAMTAPSWVLLFAMTALYLLCVPKRHSAGPLGQVSPAAVVGGHSGGVRTVRDRHSVRAAVLGCASHRGYRRLASGGYFVRGANSRLLVSVLLAEKAS